MILYLKLSASGTRLTQNKKSIYINSMKTISLLLKKIIKSLIVLIEVLIKLKLIRSLLKKQRKKLRLQEATLKKKSNKVTMVIISLNMESRREVKSLEVIWTLKWNPRDWVVLVKATILHFISITFKNIRNSTLTGQPTKFLKWYLSYGPKERNFTKEFQLRNKNQLN